MSDALSANHGLSKKAEKVTKGYTFQKSEDAKLLSKSCEKRTFEKTAVGFIIDWLSMNGKEIERLTPT